jgi:hypothetical protein
MLRISLFPIMLVGLLAMTQPVLADPIPGTATERTQAGQDDIAQPARSETASSPSPSPDNQTPVPPWRGREIPVGFGWG